MKINNIEKYKEEDLVLKEIFKVLENQRKAIIYLKNYIYESDEINYINNALNKGMFQPYEPIKQMPQFIEYISFEKQSYDPNIEYFNNSYFIKLRVDFSNWIWIEKDSFKKEFSEFIKLIVAKCNYDEYIINIFKNNNFLFQKEIKLANIDKLEIEDNILSFKLETRNYGVYKGPNIIQYDPMSIFEFCKNQNHNK